MNGEEAEKEKVGSRDVLGVGSAAAASLSETRRDETACMHVPSAVPVPWVCHDASRAALRRELGWVAKFFEKITFLHTGFCVVPCCLT